MCAHTQAHRHIHIDTDMHTQRHTHRNIDTDTHTHMRLLDPTEKRDGRCMNSTFRVKVPQSSRASSQVAHWGEEEALVS